jgi:anti-anti-sigma factor
MIKADAYNGVCVLSVVGELSGEECQAIRKAVDEQVDQRQVASFAVDMQQCTFVDSEGLESLLWIKRRADELFGMMKVAGADEHCRTILRITRLEGMLDVEPDLAGALKSMR